MERLLYFAPATGDAASLRSFLESQLSRRVVLTHDLHQVENVARENRQYMVLLKMGQSASQALAYAQHLRRLGFMYPILVMIDKMEGVNAAEAAALHQTYFLENPGPQALMGVLRKLMTARKLDAQVAKRHPTELSALVETFSTTAKYEFRLLNISQSGAYFESHKSLPLKTGDLLRLRVHLAEVDREHYVHGRVVWTVAKGDAAEFKMGVKFLKPSEIYRELVVA